MSSGEAYSSTLPSPSPPSLSRFSPVTLECGVQSLSRCPGFPGRTTTVTPWAGSSLLSDFPFCRPPIFCSVICATTVIYATIRSSLMMADSSISSGSCGFPFSFSRGTLGHLSRPLKLFWIFRLTQAFLVHLTLRSLLRYSAPNPLFYGFGFGIDRNSFSYLGGSLCDFSQRPSRSSFLFGLSRKWFWCFLNQRS